MKLQISFKWFKTNVSVIYKSVDWFSIIWTMLLNSLSSKCIDCINVLMSKCINFWFVTNINCLLIFFTDFFFFFFFFFTRNFNQFCLPTQNLNQLFIHQTFLTEPELQQFLTCLPDQCLRICKETQDFRLKNIF